MKIKTSELTGVALDWAVTMLELQRLKTEINQHIKSWVEAEILSGKRADPYSADWMWGGPIIDRELISVLPPITRRIGTERHAFPVTYWRALKQRDENELATHGRGNTALVAAMRCFVASKLGDEVDVPEELCHG